MKEPEENKCKIIFNCESTYEKPCVYRKQVPVRYCKYRGFNINGFICESAVAQVNRMVLMLKDAGFEVIKDE